MPRCVHRVPDDSSGGEAAIATGQSDSSGILFRRDCLLVRSACCFLAKAVCCFECDFVTSRTPLRTQKRRRCCCRLVNSTVDSVCPVEMAGALPDLVRKSSRTTCCTLGLPAYSPADMHRHAVHQQPNVRSEQVGQRGKQQHDAAVLQPAIGRSDHDHHAGAHSRVYALPVLTPQELPGKWITRRDGFRTVLQGCCSEHAHQVVHCDC